ncbi:MAG: hypothetical protein J6Y19_02155 [Kiritimatiellae bacterium]|nr:hypothetical protein [Kiritimatiellia bacterium]
MNHLNYMNGTATGKMPVVYLDCNVVSCLTGWLSPKEDARTMQVATRKWWKRAQGRVLAVISEVVWAELVQGDAGCAAERRMTVAGMPMWRETPATRALGRELLRFGAVDKSQPRDAAHIAVAAVEGADVLLSWNFQHVVNEDKMPEIKAVVERAGFRCPLITSPDKLPEDWP